MSIFLQKKIKYEIKYFFKCFRFAFKKSDKIVYFFEQLIQRNQDLISVIYNLYEKIDQSSLSVNKKKLLKQKFNDLYNIELNKTKNLIEELQI